MVNKVPKFSRPTGLMFHHFHNEKHPVAQGSIDAEMFEAVLRFIGIERLLRPDEWVERALSGHLREADVCITFDDALLCQYDVALPVLDKLDLKAFWFVYSSVLTGGIEKLEIYRYFRTVKFESVEAFYSAFFMRVKDRAGEAYDEALRAFVPASYLPNSPFYTDEDRWFRFLRDHFLKEDGAYDAIMEDMMAAKGFCANQAADHLWMTESQVLNLQNNGHIIGLHSDTHPTTMGTLHPDEQLREYSENQKHLTKLLDRSPNVMSHPCNSYSDKTLEILSDLGISIGFRADIAPVEARSLLEFPREDHANIVRKLT